MTDSALAEADVQRLPRAANVERASHPQALPVPLRIALWAALGVAALLFTFNWNTNVHVDFPQNVWLPSRLVLDGTNPYSPTRAQVDAALGEYSKDFAVFNSGAQYHFIYPLWVALALSPFAAIPLVPALAIWRAANIVLLVWGMGAVLRASNRVFRSVRPAVIAATTVIVFLGILPTYRPSFLTIYHGQFAIIEFGLLAAIWGWLVSTSQLKTQSSKLKIAAGDALVGVALAVLATKPQAVGLPILLIVLWAISRRRLAMPIAAVVSTAVLLLAPTLFYPWSLGDWLKIVFGGQAGSQAQVSASVWGVSYQWLGGNPLWLPLAGFLTVVGLLLLVPYWRRDLKDKTSAAPSSLALTLCINLVISPYMLGYEHVLLLFPALLLFAMVGLPGGQLTPQAERSARLWRIGLFTWLGLLPFIAYAAQAALDREYPAILLSITMLALILSSRFKVQGSKSPYQTLNLEP